MSFKCSNRVIKGDPTINGLSNDDMKLILKQNGHPTNGKRQELCTRILDNKLFTVPKSLPSPTRSPKNLSLSQKSSVRSPRSPPLKPKRTPRTGANCSPRVMKNVRNVNGLSVYQIRTALYNNGLSPLGNRMEICQRFEINKVNPKISPNLYRPTTRVVRTNSGINGLTRDEMKDLLRQNELSTHGTRAELHQRISANIK